MNIVILDGKVLNPGDVDWKPLQDLGSVTIYDETHSHQIADRVKGQQVVIVNKTCLQKEDIPSLKDTKLIAALATGYNNIDIQAFGEAHIPVCNVVAYGVEDVAQHTMAMLLELCRSTTLHSNSVKSGEWNQRNIWCYWKKTPICLAGLTLGIIGFGAIGQCVGKLGHAFGMKVLALSHSSRKEPDYTPFAYLDSLEELLSASDVVSLHCPLTLETKNIINAESIKHMRDGAILLNTARGPLIDEVACAEALKTGKLAGLGTDVLAIEPPSANNVLLKAPNTIITPHIAWATTRARQNIIDLTALNIKKWNEGSPINVVNKQYLK